jgi:hypothetical protein
VIIIWFPTTPIVSNPQHINPTMKGKKIRILLEIFIDGRRLDLCLMRSSSQGGSGALVLVSCEHPYQSLVSNPCQTGALAHLYHLLSAETELKRTESLANYARLHNPSSSQGVWVNQHTHWGTMKC